MPDISLSERQARVIGAIIEKQMTTPMGYPMTPNAVRVACNQKSNRDPVVEYSDDEVFDLLEELRQRGYVEIDMMEYSRTSKYRQTFGKALDLERGELVILCELFNRGPQTPGELRARCERMHRFKDLADVERCLHMLSDKSFIRMLERAPGTKEHRWAQLFTGEPKPAAIPGPQRAAPPAAGQEDRIARLEREIQELRARVEELESRAAN